MDQKIIEKVLNVMDRKDLSPNAKVIYSTLVTGSVQTEDDPDVYLNACDQDHIIELTGIKTKNTIIKAQKELESLGLIGITRRQRKSNVYVIY